MYHHTCLSCFSLSFNSAAGTLKIMYTACIIFLDSAELDRGKDSDKREGFVLADVWQQCAGCTWLGRKREGGSSA
jgi:hypothetical protein